LLLRCFEKVRESDALKWGVAFLPCRVSQAQEGQGCLPPTWLQLPSLPGTGGMMTAMEQVWSLSWAGCESTAQGAR
jgi:hypothetical protein